MQLSLENVAEIEHVEISPKELKQLSKAIKDDIEEWCRVTYDDGHRTHLGASQIGHECDRYLYNVFHWVKKEQFSGRMQRLFQRGHLEEPRFITYLRGIDFNIALIDEQDKVYAVNGHFGGSLDGQGKGRPPQQYIDLFPQLANLPGFLLEFKTNGTGGGFDKLLKQGVAVAKEVHYDQMCVYGYGWGYEYAIYLNTNKNDDDLHVEVVRLDFDRAKSRIARADKVINSPKPPDKIASTEAYVTCKYCNFMPVCHRGELPEKNCRSCEFSQPIADKKWFCHRWKDNLPTEVIAVGCEQWSPVGR